MAYQNIAVVLNANAGTERSYRYLNEFIGRIAVYQTSTQDDLDTVANEIISNNVEIVAVVGGDGTQYHTYNTLLRVAKQLEREVPKIAIIGEGTGNAVAYSVNAFSPKKQLQWMLENGTEVPLRVIPLVGARFDESEETYFTWAGCGLDAMILNDYKTVKSKGGLFSKGLPGYIRAGLFTSSKRVINGDLGDMQVSTANSLVKIEERRRYDFEYFPVDDLNELLGSREIHAIGVATTRDHGKELAAFPFATMAANQKMMQMRIIAGEKSDTVKQLITRFPLIWRGTYRGRPFIDFMTPNVELIGESLDVHIAGESRKASKVNYRFSDEEIKLVDFRGI